MHAVILYGPPAAGKDTVTKVLADLDARYVLFQRLKVGPGRRDGYAMTTDAALDQLRDNGQVIWENRRYGSRYVVDRPRLRAELAAGHVPVLHLGQPEGVGAVANEVWGSTRWTIAHLWCPKPVAEARLIARGSLDVSSRLTAWDETPPLKVADLSIDTSQMDASAVAILVHHWLTRPRGEDAAARRR